MARTNFLDPSEGSPVSSAPSRHLHGRTHAANHGRRRRRTALLLQRTGSRLRPIRQGRGQVSDGHCEQRDEAREHRLEDRRRLHQAARRGEARGRRRRLRAHRDGREAHRGRDEGEREDRRRLRRPRRRRPPRVRVVSGSMPGHGRRAQPAHELCGGRRVLDLRRAGVRAGGGPEQARHADAESDEQRRPEMPRRGRQDPRDLRDHPPEDAVQMSGGRRQARHERSRRLRAAERP